MARQPVNSDSASFSRGLITDANPLSPVKDSSVDEQNMLIVKDGSRCRRYGLDREDGGSNTLLVCDSGLPFVVGIKARIEQHSVHYWGEPTVNAKKHLAFINKSYQILLDNETDAPTSNLVDAFGIATEFHKEGRSTAYIGGDLMVCPINEFVSTTGRGSVKVTHGDGAGNFSSLISTLQFRDIWGLDDGLALTDRPAVLTALHAYNLLNQGWSPAQITQFFTDIGVYPSNADLPTFGLNSATGVYVANLVKNYPAKAGAPRGHYIIDFQSHASRFDASTADMTTLGLALPTLTESQNADAFSVSEYSGRAFWTVSALGERKVDPETLTPSLQSYVFFSKVVQGSVRYAIDKSSVACHSELDPTDEAFAPTVADGGFIPFPNAGQLLACGGIREGLFVFGTNGVWMLRSFQGTFDPTNTSVEQITSVGAISKKIIIAGNNIMYYANEGIYMLSYDSEANRVTTTNITLGISSLYTKMKDFIVDAGFDAARGVVNFLFNIITSTAGGVVTYTPTELVYNLGYRAWTKNVFPPYQTDVTGLMLEEMLAPIGYAVIENEFVDASDGTPVNNARVVSSLKRAFIETPSGYVSPSQPEFYYMLAEETDTTFHDWANLPVPTIDAEAYMTTQYTTDGETQRRKQVGKLVCHFNKTETGYKDDGAGNPELINQGSCLMESRWDFANSSASGKYSLPKQVYKQPRAYFPTSTTDPYDIGYDVFTSVTNIRGRGRSVQFKFSSEEDKDLQILGWGMTKSINRRN